MGYIKVFGQLSSNYNNFFFEKLSGQELISLTKGKEIIIENDLIVIPTLTLASSIFSSIFQGLYSLFLYAKSCDRSKGGLPSVNSSVITHLKNIYLYLLIGC